MVEQQLRQTAYKVKILDLLNNEYVVQQGEWEPNYILVNGERVSRVNIIANIIDKQDTDMLSSAVIDDGSGNITVRCFIDNIRLLRDKNVGDLVLIIGRPRKNNDELFIVAEIIKKLDNPNWLKLRQRELKTILTSESSTQDLRRVILEKIKGLQGEDGIEVSSLIETLTLPKETVEPIIKELLEEGEIYEPKPGVVRSIE